MALYEDYEIKAMTQRDVLAETIGMSSAMRRDDNVDAVDQSPDLAPGQQCVGGKLTQWATDDDTTYYAVGRTTGTLPPGIYEISRPNSVIGFRHFAIDTTGLMRLPDTQADKIMDEIEKFWGRSDRFKKYQITQRRGIMVVGPTGCGKTCTSKLVCLDVVRRGGVVFQLTSVKLLIYGLTLFRAIQPKTPVVVLLEDIDEIASGGDSSPLLNMLDGIYAEFELVVFMATTNFPDRLERRITNRPSRFDCIIEMAQPVESARQIYLDTLAPGLDQALFNTKRAAADTNGLSFAHLKELFVSTVILDIPYETALAKVRKMADEDLPSGDEMEFEHGERGPLGLMPVGAKSVKRLRRHTSY